MPPADSPSLTEIAAIHLHIGARNDSTGPGGDSQRHEGLRQVLVQPDPGQAKALRQSAAPEVEVLEFGLAAADGRADLRQMNFAALSSFHEPTAALQALFPGLKEVRRHSVEMLSPGTLLDRIDARGQVIDLVLDMPGSEMLLLQAWKTAGALKHVRRLALRCGSERFFEEAAPCKEIDAWLGAEGFTKTAEDLADPDWPVAHWQSDPALLALKEALAEARNVVEATSRALAESELRALGAEDRVTALDGALLEAQGALEATSKELSAALAEAEARARSAEDRVAALDEALSEAQGVLDATSKELSEALAEAEARARSAEGRVTALDDELLGAQEALDATSKELSAALAEAEARARSAEDRVTALDGELLEAQGVAERLTAQREESRLQAEAQQSRITEVEAQIQHVEQANEALRKGSADQANVQKEQQHRLALARNDLRRAEGQIELIKDLLLRGETL